MTKAAVSRLCSEDIIRRQGQVDKQYAGLKELAEERRKKLDHTYHHFLLSREVEDLEHWISERDVVASSQEMGQDLDHVTVTEPVCSHPPTALLSLGFPFISQKGLMKNWAFMSHLLSPFAAQPNSTPTFQTQKRFNRLLKSL